MSQPHPELLIIAVTLVALALAPLASHLVKLVGNQISSDLDTPYEGSELDDEIAQMIEARAFVRGEREAQDEDA